MMIQWFENLYDFWTIKTSEAELNWRTEKIFLIKNLKS